MRQAISFSRHINRPASINCQRISERVRAVDVVSGAVMRSDEEFAAMWKALLGTDPVMAHKAVTGFMASGKVVYS